MKSSQSNFDLRSPSSYLARSYQIATVLKKNSLLSNQATVENIIDGDIRDNAAQIEALQLAVQVGLFWALN